MKKLLAMYICVSALIYGSNAIASGLDMPPHDNSYTHHSLVPESVFDNSSSYQIARTYFMPDYQRNLVGKRVNDGGKDTAIRTCETYGFHGTCTPPAVGKGVKHPIPGLTCYKKCVSCADSGYVDNCASPKTGTKVTTADGLTCYKDCQCPSEFKYSVWSSTPGKIYCNRLAIKSSVKCVDKLPFIGSNGVTELRSTFLYTSCTCPSEYTFILKEGYNGPILKNGSCGDVCVIGDVRKYKCTCNDGYIQSGNECIPAENCSGYDLTTCPEGGTCSGCPDNSAKLKLDSCDMSKGWTKCGNSCCPVDCAAGYTAGVATCDSNSTKPDISLNGWSGGKQCGVCKCNNMDSNCTAANYPLTAIPDNTNYESCNTGCGSEKIFLYRISSCKTGYKLVGEVCKNDSCPVGYAPAACNAVTHNQDTTTTEAGTTCYKCTPKDDTCPGGYQKNACSSSQKQTGTSSTELGSICYQCKDDTCPGGYQKSGCSVSQKQTGKTTTAAGTTCYQCKDDTCPSGYSKTACTSSQTQTSAATTDAGTECYKCESNKPTCPRGLFLRGDKTCADYEVMENKERASDGISACYGCRFKGCSAADTEYHDTESSCKYSQLISLPATTEDSPFTCYKCVGKICSASAGEYYDLRSNDASAYGINFNFSNDYNKARIESGEYGFIDAKKITVSDPYASGGRKEMWSTEIDISCLYDTNIEVGEYDYIKDGMGYVKKKLQKRNCRLGDNWTMDKDDLMSVYDLVCSMALQVENDCLVVKAGSCQDLGFDE